MSIEPRPIWDHELAAIPNPAINWLWEGYLAAGHITLLTGLWRAGKTTLLSLLLSRRKQGGSLGGLAVKPGKTIVVTEENSTLWALRARRDEYGGQACFFPQPFRGIPRPEEWLALVVRILQLQAAHGFDLLVLDPLAPLLRNENQARTILDCFKPLSELTGRGVGVLAMHHPSKGNPPLGQAARGSGALLGHVDISMEVRRVGGDPHSRRRRFFAWSRLQAPPQLLMELNPEGTDYIQIPDDHEEGFDVNWHLLELVLSDAPQKLTRLDILDEWPPDFEKPSAVTLQMWLNRAVDRALILREGSGRRSDPFRYWFATREEYWKETYPFYEFFEQQKKNLKLPFQSLREKRRIDSSDEPVDPMRADDDGEGKAGGEVKVTTED
jgi:hypothetical protein